MINIKPEKLHLINFTSYKDEIIDFSKFTSPTLICGDNGNGKSSIIDAITTALYCRARSSDVRGSGIDDLISNNAKEFTIDYSFTMNDHLYRIVRTKSKTSHKLSFYIDDHDYSSSLKETQQKIIDVLKINYNTFIDTVCISQNGASSFMEKSAKERKEIFAQILNLEEYAELEKFTRDLRKNLVVEFETIQNEISALKEKTSFKTEYEDKLNLYERKLDEINIEPLQLKLEALLSLKSQIDTLKSKNKLILDQRQRLKDMIRRYERLISNDMNELTNLKVIDIDPLQRELDEKTNQLENIGVELERLNKVKNQHVIDKSILMKEIATLKEKKKNIQNYNKATCNFCGHELTERYKQQYIDDLNQSGNDLFIKIKDLTQKIEHLDQQSNEKQTAHKKINQDVKKLNQQIQINSINEAKQHNLRKNLENNNDELSQLKINLIENEKEKIENIEVEVNDAEVNTLKHKISSLKNESDSYKSKIAILKDRLQLITSYEEKIQTLKKGLKEKELVLEDYKSLINAFSKDGISSYIIENTLPEIEEEINTLLKDLTNNKISISFIIQKETKSKTMIDTLDVLVHDENVSRKYETFSGGEKFRIDFAIHVGLSRFLAKRAQASIDLFILDENLGSQDETAKEIFIQYLTKLNKYFKQILIITHINDVKEAFANKIYILKNDKRGSYVSYS